MNSATLQITTICLINGNINAANYGQLRVFLKPDDQNNMNRKRVSPYRSSPSTDSDSYGHFAFIYPFRKIFKNAY